MADWEEARTVAMTLPGTTDRLSYGNPGFAVHDQVYCWLRPLRKSDLAELGDRAPAGPVIAFRTADEAEKVAWIAECPDVFFTTSHFEGYPAVLARLASMDAELLARVMGAAWRTRATGRRRSRRRP
jgi:hypothetical protein